MHATAKSCLEQIQVISEGHLPHLRLFYSDLRLFYPARNLRILNYHVVDYQRTLEALD